MSATLEVSGFCKIKSKRILHKPGTRAGDVIFCSNTNSINSESIWMCTRIEKLSKWMTGAETKVSPCYRGSLQTAKESKVGITHTV